MPVRPAQVVDARGAALPGAQYTSSGPRVASLPASPKARSSDSSSSRGTGGATGSGMIDGLGAARPDPAADAARGAAKE